MTHWAYNKKVWAIATILSGLCYLFAFRFFPQTFPIVRLDISMDLEQALQKADSLTQKYNFGPTDYRHAAAFHTDTLTKTFIELEAGGTPAFISMMDNHLYEPYTWNVRHFKEFTPNETIITFTPDGKPYGFVETLSENEEGAQLSEQSARQLAERIAQEEWNVSFSSYKQLETSQKTQPSGRIDHTFIYERTPETIGEGFYRLKLYVSGDKVTELTHFIKVPETFIRRYGEMRAANNFIAWIATLIMGVLYVLGGCLIGLYYLSRRKWLLWKKAEAWGILIGVLSGLLLINQLPSLWMGYNSAHTYAGFLIQIISSAILSATVQAFGLTLIIAAAEGLTRRAFGKQPQLWALWKQPNSASYQVLGRTIGAYLLVGFECAFVIGFYHCSTHYLGWWNPSELLFDPNILASYLPWLSPLAMSLYAGFIEECLFRAIPLSCAALLGKQFGKKNLCIGAAFILQALVFGAAHANYPTQPAYARLVELLIPSFLWAAVYLRFGLLTTIITHVVYDIIWFSIPLFVSTAPHALMYKCIIVLGSCIPLFVIAWARLRHKGWTMLSEHSMNAAWQPTQSIEKPQEIISSEHLTERMPRATKATMAMVGIISLVVWIWVTPFTHDGRRITQTRQDAVAFAHDFLTQKHETLSAPWKEMPLFFTHYQLISQLNTQHTFVWREGGKEQYHQLLNTYLQPAHWTIRYAQFEGDLIARAEEHKIMLYDATRHYHQLPESAEGKQLSKDAARVIAHKALHDIYHMTPSQLIEKDSMEIQLPHRKNWTFIFADPAAYSLEKGEARIFITIAGDTIVDTSRFIHVPEEWERTEQNDVQQRNIIHLILGFIFTLLVLMTLMYAQPQHLTSLFSSTTWLVCALSIIAIGCAETYNQWPTIMGAWNTIEPLTTQLFRQLISILVGIVIKGISLGFLLAWLFGIKPHVTHSFSVITGIAVGLLYAAIMSVAHLLVPSLQPLWPDYAPLASMLPTVTTIISTIFAYIYTTTFFTLGCIAINRATHFGKQRMWLVSGMCSAFGLLLVSLPTMGYVVPWLIVGICVGSSFIVLYRSIVRYDSSVMPIITGTFLITKLVQQGMFNAYPGALFNALICVGITIGISLLWWKNNCIASRK